MYLLYRAPDRFIPGRPTIFVRNTNCSLGRSESCPTRHQYQTGQNGPHASLSRQMC